MEGRRCGVTPSDCGEGKWLAHTRRAGRAVQVSTDCRFQRHMLSGAWVKELTVIGVCVVQKIAASLGSCVSDLLFPLLCPCSRKLARLAGLTTENLVRHGNLELPNGSFKGYFVTIHSLVGHKKGVSQEVVFNHKNFGCTRQAR